MGLGLDDWDIDYYYNLFVKDIGRNPTNVECFDLSQSNSEHSRHWFFRGRLVVDGKEVSRQSDEDQSSRPLTQNPNNSVIAFKDNSSAIRGYEITTIIPEKPGRCITVRKDRCATITSSLRPRRITSRAALPLSPAPRPAPAAGSRDVQATGTRRACCCRHCCILRRQSAGSPAMNCPGKTAPLPIRQILPAL